MPRQVTPLMQKAYDLRMAGKLEAEIATLMEISLKGAFQLISRCRALGMELPRRRRLKGTSEETSGTKELPPNMPSKKIARCPDCLLMLSSEGSCIDCRADKRRMLVLLTGQRRTSGTMYGLQEEALEDGRGSGRGLLTDFKKGVARMAAKYEPKNKETE